MSKKKSPPPISPLLFSQSLSLPCCGVDVHAHMDSKEFRQDIFDVLNRAQSAGIAHIGNVFLGPAAYARNRALFDARPEVFFLLGIHPNEADECSDAALDAMRAAFAKDTRLKAVGEIGLDYYWKDCPPPVQRRAFIAQLTMARACARPVAIHCREAVDDTLAVLEGEGFAHYPLLWHCFGGDSALAARLVGNGWHISVPGPVGYPANGPLREAVRMIPADRLLLETDCPYLAPLEWRGRRNEPAFAVFTAACIAAERGESPATLWERCGRNAVRFFGLE